MIGRLLHDSKAILEDQLEHVARTSERRGDGYLNLALLTDGLRAEREQGITIDVAYRYFQTGSAAAVGSENGDVAPRPSRTQVHHRRHPRPRAVHAQHGHRRFHGRCVDRAGRRPQGVSEQTRRHAYIASLLRIPHLVVAVNKMDLVGYSEEAFDAIVDELSGWASRLSIPDITFIPMSALNGDNVVERSLRDAWYDGRRCSITSSTW